MSIAILARLPIWLDDLVHEHPYRVAAVALLLASIVIVGIAWALKKFWIAGMDFPCTLCGTGTARPLRALSDADRQTVLRYFRQCEDREPDAEGIFVCENCHTVYDDFSGEKGSRTPDLVSVPNPRTGQEDLKVGFICFCKRCELKMMGNTPKYGPIVCRECKTAHEWREFERTGYTFLMTDLPPGTIKTRKRHFEV